MSIATITQAGKSVSVHFSRHFFVQENTLGEIFWDADTQRSGIIKLWIQSADTNPRVAFVLPDWEISINGISLEKKLYEEIGNLLGKIVEIRYRNYTFKFDFIQ